MFEIDDNNNITLTRGDTLIFDVDIVNMDDEPYELQEGDEIYFVLHNYVKINSNNSEEVSYIKREFFKCKATVEEGNIQVLVSSPETVKWTAPSYTYSLKLVNKNTTPNLVFTVIDNATITLIN